jgi:hypothetical protein
MPSVNYEVRALSETLRFADPALAATLRATQSGRGARIVATSAMKDIRHQIDALKVAHRSPRVARHNLNLLVVDARDKLTSA